ncbi:MULTISPECIES: SDR family NAD(P)-dependent oxidoreductase [unclassified Saccharicrinis]|uniref:SDR family NAD(P)-dependent oxidoreductase n=1 Tax=unclassified Saccharicrinis TaxID=2646859 RepID=UPI003D343720
MKQKIIITGASGGFGFLTSKALVDKGHEVVGTMRSTSGKNETVANDLKSIGVQLVDMDVTDEVSVNKGIGKALESNPEQKPQLVADAIANLLELPYGEKPMRTVVDKIGLQPFIWNR